MKGVVWPAELVEEIALGRVVLFLGSGVSANSKNSTGRISPPTWWKFLNDLTPRLPRAIKPGVKEILSRNNLLLACDVIRGSITAPVFKAELRKAFHDPGYLPSDAHRSLLRLGARITVTPNFDVIYDNFVAAETSNTVLVKNYYDEDAAESLRSKYPVIFKLHGSITSPDKLIFTGSDYAAARTKAAGFYSLMRALLCTHTFLFVGCGLDDPDIKVLLEDYRYSHGVSRQHYFLVPSGLMHKKILAVAGDSLNLSFIEFDNSDGSFKNFQVALDELVQAVELQTASA